MLIKGLVKDDLYIMDQVLSKMCFATSVCSRGNLWNQHLGYLNHKIINVMKDQELMKGLPSISLSIGLCKKCIFGKMHR